LDDGPEQQRRDDLLLNGNIKDNPSRFSNQTSEIIYSYDANREVDIFCADW